MHTVGGNEVLGYVEDYYHYSSHILELISATSPYRVCLVATFLGGYSERIHYHLIVYCYKVPHNSHININVDQ